MSERSERIAKFVQILLHASADGDGSPIMPRMYRSIVFDALAENRKALPRDLGALSLVLQAGELFGRGLYFSRGTMHPKAFVGEGFHQLMAWLNRCTALFAQVEEVYDDLSPMPEEAGDVRAVAKAFAYTCDDLFANINAHTGEDDEDGQGASDDGAEEEQPSVILAAQAIKEILMALGTVMCAWFTRPRTQAVMDAITEGATELCRCRDLMEKETKGNA